MLAAERLAEREDIKMFREEVDRLATRYDKLAENFLAHGSTRLNTPNELRPFIVPLSRRSASLRSLWRFRCFHRRAGRFCTLARAILRQSDDSKRDLPTHQPQPPPSALNRSMRAELCCCSELDSANARQRERLFFQVPICKSTVANVPDPFIILDYFRGPVASLKFGADYPISKKFGALLGALIPFTPMVRSDFWGSRADFRIPPLPPPTWIGWSLHLLKALL